MQKLIATCILLIVGTVTAKSQGITLNFDLSNAKETLRLLSQSSISEQEMKSFLALKGTQAIIKKVHSSEDTARSAMMKVTRGISLTSQESFLFQYDGVYKDRTNLKLYVEELDRKKDSIQKVLANKFKTYIPAGQNLNVTVYGLMGSYSGGWANSDDPHSFYMGMHFKPYDVNGTLITCEHELFHNIQAISYSGTDSIYSKIEKVSAGYGVGYYLGFYLFREGSAEFEADLEKAAINSASAKKSWEHMAVNKNRLKDAFYLFERIVIDFSLRKEITDQEFQHAYNLLFDWNWNNPGYYVGKVMTEQLVSTHGKDYLKQALKKDPLYFLQDYIKLSNVEGQKNVHRFSKEFEELVAKMISIKES